MLSSSAQQHLERRLGVLRGNQNLRVPPRGWVRAIREALGMTAAQLADRMGVFRTRISALEQGEVAGTVSLATLRRAAAAMDCTLVYAWVPNRPLRDMVEERAMEVSRAMLERVDQTMRLEDQLVEGVEMSEQLERLRKELLERPKRLWRQP